MSLELFQSPSMESKDGMKFQAQQQKAFFVTIPHSGEYVPSEVAWLQGLSEAHLMCDVDRFVDELYKPTLQSLQIPHVIAECHRYVVDLNRRPQDIDCDSVLGSENPSGTFTSGFHWVKTTTGLPLIAQPMTQEAHQKFVHLYFEPFHREVRALYQKLEQGSQLGKRKVFHIDLHSMPSRGTAAHRDPGSYRADIVVSDQNGATCDPSFKDLVTKSYEAAGFRVAYNWPYIGGRITEDYGRPQQGQHVVQVELNRGLYMDEVSKKKVQTFSETQRRLAQALSIIHKELPTS